MQTDSEAASGESASISAAKCQLFSHCGSAFVTFFIIWKSHFPGSRLMRFPKVLEPLFLKTNPWSFHLAEMYWQTTVLFAFWNTFASILFNVCNAMQIFAGRRDRYSSLSPQSILVRGQKYLHESTQGQAMNSLTRSNRTHCAPNTQDCLKPSAKNSRKYHTGEQNLLEVINILQTCSKINKHWLLADVGRSCFPLGNVSRARALKLSMLRKSSVSWLSLNLQWNSGDKNRDLLQTVTYFLWLVSTST